MKIRKLFLAAGAACIAHGSAWSIPNGGVVIRGGATFDPRGNVLIITNTPGTIIDWQGFSIGAGESTRFVQQGSSSAVLNRIVGQDPSQILGALQSNGRVFLVNPNGIVFGAGAQVDVNGLVASTLNITNEDFAAGRHAFNAADGRAGAIRNDGAITTPAGGRVYLIAPSIENNGIISSPRGEVMLAAGHHVQLVDSGSPDLQVVVSAPADRAVNLGRILSEGGSVGIYGALVNQQGVVNADSAVRGEDGRIVFRASGETRLEEGSVTSARGVDRGGNIQILGDHVGLTGDALVDASGQRGGGTVLVGGDFHGANPNVANASATFIGAQATIRADAIESGDGGRVAVWSDGATRAYGRISARGGENSGDGGFAEVSGRGYLDYGARTDLRASHGTAGTLLLDPNDITIQAGPASGSDVPASGPPVTFSGGPSSSVITVTDLQNQLMLGSVTVSTAGGAGGPLGGRITVADAISYGGGSLTLSADNGIAINGAISAPLDGRLTLVNNGGTITQTAPINVTYVAITSLGDVNLDTAPNTVYALTARVGDASHPGLNFRFLNSGGFLVHSLSGLTGITADQGYIALTATSGSITQTSGSILAGQGATIRADSVVLTEANAVNVVSGRLNGVPGSDGFAFTSAGSFDAGTVMGIAGIQAPGAPANLMAAGAITGSIAADHIALSAGNGISVTTQTPAITATNAAGAISIANMGGLSVEDVTGPAAITITTQSPLTVAGMVNSTGGGAITLSAGPTGSVTDQLTINGSVSSTGPILLRAGDAITVNGTVTGPTTQQPFLNIPVLPTLAACIANPTLPGCSAVLPSLSQCVVNPALQGCNIVLPTLAQCTATPLAAGCSAVLPTLGQCTAAPTLAGCSVVLPFLSACIANPALAGCSAVLPTIALCTATPTLAGCSAVLPTLAQCIATPNLAGCGAVLPTIAQCTVTPGLPGCSVLLPTLAQCIAAPTLAGCAAVLPTLAQCAISPTLAGCAAVLPSLAQCTAAPALAGCSAVLPTLATCVANPTAAGCSAVLPTLAQCVAAPTQPGCGAVLPTLAMCVATPTLAGCSSVLPTASVCAVNPTSAICLIIAPLSSSSPPVVQAVNNTVNLINTSTPPTVASAQTTGSSGSSMNTPDGKKADDKKTDSSATDKSGAKNEPTKKLYCN